jgi:serine/threonine-protein kinase
VGVVGLGLGTIFGLQAMSKKNDAQSECPNKCATADGVAKWNDAASAGTVSTVGFIIGAVGLAGGAVLWFTAPSGDASKTQVGLGPGGFQLKGSW